MLSANRPPVHQPSQEDHRIVQTDNLIRLIDNRKRVKLISKEFNCRREKILIYTQEFWCFSDYLRNRLSQVICTCPVKFEPSQITSDLPVTTRHPVTLEIFVESAYRLRCCGISALQMLGLHHHGFHVDLFPRGILRSTSK